MSLENRKSTTFLLPLILENTKIRTLLTPDYIGTYYQDTNKPEWGKKIYLVYKHTKPNLNISLFYRNSKYKYNKYEETVNNETYYIYCFIIPPVYKKDFENIINGKYSKITNARHKIKNAWALSGIIGNLVNETLDLPPTKTRNINGELLNAFDEREILNLNKVPLKKEGVNTLSFSCFCTLYRVQHNENNF